MKTKKFHSVLSISLFVLALVSFSAFKPKGVVAGYGGPVPTAPTKVSAVSGPGNGQVTLYWDTSAYADNYGVVYGVASGNYVYGSLNIGGEQARSFTVSYLTPGVRYYFKVLGIRNDTAGPLSSEVSAVAAGTADGGVKVAVGGPVQTEVSGVPTGKHRLMAVSGPQVGEVTLSWQHADNADNYHLVYGTAPGKYQYGALSIGKITSFTVQKLAPGTTYYFALVPVVNGQGKYTTEAVSAKAKPVYVEVIETTKEALVQPPLPSAITTPEADSPQPIITIPPLESPQAPPATPETNVVEPPAEEQPVSPVE